ncbi:MAG: energy transducer TonB, partial [Proteobacteria bacterium]|nr:energy transducer TonB [Pseudomonadota bacterium]
MSAVAPAIGSREKVSVTFLFSLVLHGVLVLGLTFAYEKPAPSLPS